jgi:heme iron utilization protein
MSTPYPSNPEPPSGSCARNLRRDRAEHALYADRASSAALATFSDRGQLMGSIVTLCLRDEDGLFFSLGDGCEHARNLARDARATLMVADDASARARVTFAGRAAHAGRDADGRALYRLSFESVRVSPARADESGSRRALP